MRRPLKRDVYKRQVLHRASVLSVSVDEPEYLPAPASAFYRLPDEYSPNAAARYAKFQRLQAQVSIFEDDMSRKIANRQAAAMLNAPPFEMCIRDRAMTVR